MIAVMERRHATWVIVASFVIAACLAVMPMPDWLSILRPEWMALVLIYWVMALPHRIGMGLAWICGFFLDVLEGNLMGLNALTLTLIAYMSMSLYQRLRMFTLLQQSSTVFILVGLHQLLSFWILSVTDRGSSPNLLYMLSALTSAVVWPFIFVTLRHFRRNFQVN